MISKLRLKIHRDSTKIPSYINTKKLSHKRAFSFLQQIYDVILELTEEDFLMIDELLLKHKLIYGFSQRIFTLIEEENRQEIIQKVYHQIYNDLQQYMYIAEKYQLYEVADNINKFIQMNDSLSDL
jgi:hypothetical protein